MRTSRLALAPALVVATLGNLSTPIHARADWRAFGAAFITAVKDTGTVIVQAPASIAQGAGELISATGSAAEAGYKAAMGDAEGAEQAWNRAEASALRAGTNVEHGVTAPFRTSVSVVREVSHTLATGKHPDELRAELARMVAACRAGDKPHEPETRRLPFPGVYLSIVASIPDGLLNADLRDEHQTAIDTCIREYAARRHEAEEKDEDEANRDEHIRDVISSEQVAVTVHWMDVYQQTMDTIRARLEEHLGRDLGGYDLSALMSAHADVVADQVALLDQANASAVAALTCHDRILESNDLKRRFSVEDPVTLCLAVVR